MEGSAVVGVSVAGFRAVVSGAVGAEGGGAAGVRREGRRWGGDPQPGEHHDAVAGGDRRSRVDRRRGADPEFGPGADRVECVRFPTRFFVYGQPRFPQGRV